jgi:replicative DNA helicase
MIDLEFEILSSVSLNQSAFPLVIENEQLFYKWRHLYDILYSMYDEGVNFSFPSIHSRLVEYKNQEYGNTIIAKLSQSSGLSINIKDYINQLCKLRKRESLRDLAISIQEGIKNKTLNLEEIESLIESEMEKMNNQNIDDGDMLSEFTKQTLDEIFPSEAAHKTGIPELDEKLYGIKDGQVCIIAARPSKGKTALALQICERMAKHNPEEKIILFFTQDAPREELYARLLARRARVESWKIEYKKFDEEEGERVSIAHEFFKESGYKIKFYTNVSDINQVKAKIRKHKAVKAVFIDYIQQFSGDKKGGREAEVAGISRSIKNMAMAMNIPFIILSQLNRAIEIHNREPIYSDIRESGSLEQDANIIIFIHSSDEERSKDIEDSNFYLAKNKNGRTGKICTNFNKPYFEFGLIGNKHDTDWINN